MLPAFFIDAAQSRMAHRRRRRTLTVRQVLWPHDCTSVSHWSPLVSHCLQSLVGALAARFYTCLPVVSHGLQSFVGAVAA